MSKRRIEKKLIENQKAGKLAFEKRRSGLLKKAKELSFLCDIKMLVILYNKDEHEPEIWPDNDKEVEQIIETFKQNRASKKTGFGSQFSLSDHKNMINHYSQNELRNLVSDLDDKISAIVNLIESKQFPLTALKILGDYQETGFLTANSTRVFRHTQTRILSVTLSLIKVLALIIIPFVQCCSLD